MRLFTILLAAIPYLQSVICRHNVTVDDQDPTILYNPRASWVRSVNSTLDVGGAHMLTQDPTATATFTFTGIGVYYMAPLWPYTVNTAISLDSGTTIFLDLVDHSKASVGQGPETVQSQVIWGSGELPNRQHTLVVSVSAGQPFAVVDALVYTALDPGDEPPTSNSISSTTTSASSSRQPSSSPTSSSSSTTSAGAATTSTSNSASNSSSHVLPIALGTVFGVLALLLILLGIWFCYRRRRRPASEAWTVAGNPYPGFPSTTPPMPVNGGGGGYGYPGVNQPYDHSWQVGPSQGLIPGAMSPATAAALAHPYATATPVMDEAKNGEWQGTTTQIAQRYMRSPNRYQPNTLSTITETSTPHGTPQAHSPGSNMGEIVNDNITSSAHTENRAPPFPVLPSDRSYPRPPAYIQ